MARVSVFDFRFSGCGIQVAGLGFRVSVSGCEFGILGLWVGIWESGCGVWDLGFLVLGESLHHKSALFLLAHRGGSHIHPGKQIFL